MFKTKLVTTACALVMTVSLVGCNSAKNADMSNVVFDNQEFKYDGSAKTLEIKNLPDVLNYTFDISNASGAAVQPSDVVNVGSYTFTANFSAKVANVIVPDPMKATLTIVKGTYDMSDFTFGGLEVAYDGEAHKPVVSGVPTGVTSTIKVFDLGGTELPDGATDAGAYKVVASFVGDTANYNSIANKEGYMVVKQADYDDDDIHISGLAYTYDGQAHLPTVTGLPAGVTALFTVFKDGETSPVAAAIDAGKYQVTISFIGDKNHNVLSSQTVDLIIGKATYDMSKLKWDGLEVTYDGKAHKPTVSGLPLGVSATIKLLKGGSGDPLDEATEVGLYEAVASFKGDETNYNLIADSVENFVLAKAIKHIEPKAFSRTFNVDDDNRTIAIEGDLKGLLPQITYFDENGDAVEDIDEAPVGEYDVIATFEDDNYVGDTFVKSKLTVTDKVVKNITNYDELVAMAAEVQDNFTLYEATGVNEVTGEIDSWEQYNGGDPKDRWANKVTYQLLNDVDCNSQTWKAVGWHVGDFLLTEEKNIGGEDVRVVKGTDYVVNVPRTDGSDDYGFGYLSLFLDGNGYAIQNLRLDNNTHENVYDDAPGHFPSYLANMSSYRNVGMFVSTAFSTFKNIVFENPVMEIDDTASTVVWAGFINATESQGNTYEGLTFEHPVITASTAKANIGVFGGITLVLARQTDPAGERGADFYLDRPEEMEINFKDIFMNDIEFNVATTGGRNSVGGLFGENQSAGLTFNLDNVNIAGDITLQNSSNKNYAADLFGYIALKYQSKGYFVKDYDAFYKFNVSNSTTAIKYHLPAAGGQFGTHLEGNSYRRVQLTSETYEASKYYVITYRTNTFALATGAFDATEHYYELVENEKFDTPYFSIDCNVDYAGILNDKTIVANSKSSSKIVA